MPHDPDHRQGRMLQSALGDYTLSSRLISVVLGPAALSSTNGLFDDTGTNQFARRPGDEYNCPNETIGNIRAVLG